MRDDPLRARAVGTAGLDVLRAEARTDGDRLAAIGYCFGGTLSLELARAGPTSRPWWASTPGSAPARPEDARNIRGKVLMLIGADDPIVDNAQRRDFEEEMRPAGWTGSSTSTAARCTRSRIRARPRSDLPGIAYHELTDRRSWQAMLDLFDEVFG